MEPTSQSANTHPHSINWPFLTHGCEAPDTLHSQQAQLGQGSRKQGEETRCSTSPWAMTLGGALWTGKTNVQYISTSVEASCLSHHHRKDLVQVNYHQMTGWSGQQYQTWVSVMASAVSKSNTPWWQYWTILGKQKSILLSRLFTFHSYCHMGQLSKHYSDWAKRLAGWHLQGRSSWGITYQVDALGWG